MGLKVYVWSTTDSNSGHASLELGATYISYWPTHEDGEFKDKLINPPHKGNLKDFKLGLTHKASFPSSYRADRRLERKEADHQIRLDGLDESKMAEQWEHFKSNPKRYNMQHRNCSTIVASFLELGSGIPYKHTPSIKINDYITDPKKRFALKLRYIGHSIEMWTPKDVFEYALQIKSIKQKL